MRKQIKAALLIIAILSASSYVFAFAGNNAHHVNGAIIHGMSYKGK